MRIPREVHVCEVGPRDGLQNESVHVQTADKLRLITGLAEAGVPEIEVTSFVRDDVLPQFADAERVVRSTLLAASVQIRALVPNHRGAERALRSGAPTILQVIAASESFNRKNVRRSIAESIAELEATAAAASGSGAEALLSVATAFGCPYEADVSLDAVTKLVEAGERMGLRRVEICDTIGVANPKQVYTLCDNLRGAFPQIRFELHFHDTRGLALANVLAAMDAGITEFAGSLGGMGGCPFAPGAAGNVCTLDLVYMLNEMGIRTGIQPDRLFVLARSLEGILGRRLPGRVLRVMEERALVNGHVSYYSPWREKSLKAVQEDVRKSQ